MRNGLRDMGGLGFIGYKIDTNLDIFRTFASTLRVQNFCIY